MGGLIETTEAPNRSRSLSPGIRASAPAALHAATTDPEPAVVDATTTDSNAAVVSSAVVSFAPDQEEVEAEPHGDGVDGTAVMREEEEEEEENYFEGELGGPRQSLKDEGPSPSLTEVLEDAVKVVRAEDGALSWILAAIDDG